MKRYKLIIFIIFQQSILFCQNINFYVNNSEFVEKYCYTDIDKLLFDFRSINEGLFKGSTVLNSKVNLPGLIGLLNSEFNTTVFNEYDSVKCVAFKLFKQDNLLINLNIFEFFFDNRDDLKVIARLIEENNKTRFTSTKVWTEFRIVDKADGFLLVMSTTFLEEPIQLLFQKMETY